CVCQSCSFPLFRAERRRLDRSRSLFYREWGCGQTPAFTLTSGLASPPKMPPPLKRLYPPNHPSRLILKPRPLFDIILLRILSSLILKVQIPQIVVDRILTLPQIVHPRLI